MDRSEITFDENKIHTVKFDIYYYEIKKIRLNDLGTFTPSISIETNFNKKDLIISYSVSSEEEACLLEEDINYLIESVLED